MKRKNFKITFLFILFALCITFLFPVSSRGTENCEEESINPREQSGVIVISHEEIVQWGARTLSDVLARVPGIRISYNSSQSRPSSGPIISSDSLTQLSANQFSRVQIMFDGHHLNKNWYGGADQEWGTGFLEGLKEIRIYTGPAALSRTGNVGAMDTVIDLIPIDGKEQMGKIDLTLTGSLNKDGWDKSLAHLSTGNLWGDDGHYSVFADVTGWRGEKIEDPYECADIGSRLDRKNPTFQVGTIINKGEYNVRARYLEHYLFDPYNCGRKWSYAFIEGSRDFLLPGCFNLEVTGSWDYIISKWGNASSATGEKEGDWDKVKESRINLRAEINRKSTFNSLFLGANFQASKIDGGPERSGDYYSAMNFSDRSNRVGIDAGLLHSFSERLSAKGAVRFEKAKNYSKMQFLPELSLLYKREKTEAGLSFAVGHRYMDTWFRVGSEIHFPDSTMPVMPYIIPTELKPERNSQLRAWINQKFGEVWLVNATVFTGKYTHLMGIDWEYALENGFNRLQAAEVGSYSYWGGSAGVAYKRKGLTLGGNISLQGVLTSDLKEKQLYVTFDGNQPLYLPTVVGNLFMDWMLGKRLSISAYYFISGDADNAGVDFTSPDFDIIYNSYPYENTGSYSSLDLSVRLMNILNKFEIQFSAHNALNEHPRIPNIEGGSFLSRGRELTLTIRSRF